MAELVQAARTTDGRLFDTMVEAERHEASGDLRAVMQGAGVARGGEWDADMFHRFLVEHAAELAPLMARLSAPSG